MATFRIDKISISQFKGANDVAYEVSQKTDICGKNGSGKTTLGMAMVLPMTGKDLIGRSNPEIHPNDLDESEPHDIIEGTIDGKPITLEMIQKDTRTKKQIEAGAPPKISNKYRINGVDKSATAFKADLLEKGIDLSLYEKLTSPYFFMNLKEADKRATVFDMASDISDTDVSKAIGAEVSDVTEKLDTYKLEEVEALAKQQKKKASERLDAIPEQIIGLEKGKPEIDNEAELNAKRQRIEATIEAHGERIKELDKLSPWTIDSQIASIEAKQTAIVTSANTKRQEEISKKRKLYNDSCSKLTSVKDEIAYLERQMSMKESEINRDEATMNDLLKEYEGLKVEKFPEDKTVCPVCGQKFQKEKIDSLKAEWESRKADKVAKMKTNGNQYAKQIKAMKTELAAVSAHLAEVKTMQNDAEKAVKASEKAFNKANETPSVDGSSIPEWKALEVEKAELKKKSEEVEKAKAEKVEILTAVATLKSDLSDIDRELGKRSVVEHIDNQILSLKKEQKESAQAKADAERILYHCQLISQKKNDMLSESVNSRFPDYIRFKLFDTLKNGEIVNCCKPEIKDENGEWKELGTSANTALEMRAKIAILEGFQNFHDMHVPIIIDNAECLDSNSKKLINANTQLIFLTVVDDLPLTVNKL